MPLKACFAKSAFQMGGQHDLPHPPHHIPATAHKHRAPRASLGDGKAAFNAAVPRNYAPQGAGLLMNSNNQAAELQKIIDALRDAQPSMKAMGDALERHAARQLRTDALCKIEDFIIEASRIECKHIVNMLIDRVSELDGIAPELEDASAKLTRSIANET